MKKILYTYIHVYQNKVEIDSRLEFEFFVVYLKNI